MKTPNSARRRGFTLVELLVVMAIIVVLAGVGFAAGNAALEYAKRLKAKAACTSLEMGVNNFFTEYSTLPVDAAADTTVDTNNPTEGVGLLNVLLGKDTDINTRGVNFLADFPQGKANKNGIMYSDDGATVLGLYDPWGGSYHVRLDCDYDEKIDVQPKAAGASKVLNNRRVAAWSDGADGVDGAGTVKDDITTW